MTVKYDKKLQCLSDKNSEKLCFGIKHLKCFK